MFKVKQMASVAAAVVSLAFGIAPATAAPTIGFGAPVVNGATIDVDIVVGNLGSEIVSAYDLDVAYDELALTFLDFVFSDKLGGPLDAIEILGGTVAGLVDIFSVSLLTVDDDIFALQNGGPVTLGTLQFTGSDAGSLAFVNWGPYNDVKGRRAQVIIGQVPEPATYGLIGMALLAAGVARRRQA